jgi:chemotaxis protein MotB
MAEEECEECPPPGAPAWMATFADLSTLLLTFFVLLLSFANMDIIKFESMSGSLKDAFGYQEENFGNYHPEMIARQTKMESEIEQLLLGGPRKKLRKMERKVRDLIQTKKLEKKVSTETNEKGLIIRVKDQAFFSGGGARLKRQGFPILDEVSKLLAGFPCQILVEGHTDNSPIHTRRFPSNWELSAARSIAVMRYMVEVGGISPTRIGAAGYADMRPLHPNDTIEHKLANRRVEFVCHRVMHNRNKVYKNLDDAKAKGEAIDPKGGKDGEGGEPAEDGGAEAPEGGGSEE